jgi:hypothetical protein
VCPFCAEETCQEDAGRAFSQHGEMGRASDCRDIGLMYGGHCVENEREDASQKPPWR